MADLQYLISHCLLSASIRLALYPHRSDDRLDRLTASDFEAPLMIGCVSVGKTVILIASKCTYKVGIGTEFYTGL